MQFCPSCCLVGSSSLPLDVEYVFLFWWDPTFSCPMVVQQWVVILEFSQEKMSTRPSSPPSRISISSGVKSLPKVMVLCFSGGPTVFPVVSALCHISPSECLHGIQPQSFPWGPTHIDRAYAPSLYLLLAEASMWITFLLVIVVQCNLCGEFSQFCLIVISSDVPKLLTEAACERVSYFVETSPPSWFPP